MTFLRKKRFSSFFFSKICHVFLVGSRKRLQSIINGCFCCIS